MPKLKLSTSFDNIIILCNPPTPPSSVAQWSSRPPQKQKIVGSNPARVEGFRPSKIAILFLKLKTYCFLDYLRKKMDIKILSKCNP
jgi:hypothetical protein